MGIQNVDRLSISQRTALLILSQFFDEKKIVIGGSFSDMLNLSSKGVKHSISPKDLDIMVCGWDSIRELEKHFKIIEALPSEHADCLGRAFGFHIEQVYVFILGVKIDIFILDTVSFKKVKTRRVTLLNQIFRILTTKQAIIYHKEWLNYFQLEGKTYWENKHGNRLDLYE